MLTDLYIADAGGEVKEKTIAEAYQGLQQIPRKKKKGYVDIVFVQVIFFKDGVR